MRSREEIQEEVNEGIAEGYDFTEIVVELLLDIRDLMSEEAARAASGVFAEESAAIASLRKGKAALVPNPVWIPREDREWFLAATGTDGPALLRKLLSKLVTTDLRIEVPTSDQPMICYTWSVPAEHRKWITQHGKGGVLRGCLQALRKTNCDVDKAFKLLSKT